MPKYLIKAAGSKQGAIGRLYCEKREFLVDADNDEQATVEAIRHMHQKENLEHVLVTSIKRESINV